MAQIDKPNLHFNTALYTGNGTTQSITSLDFQPDLTWIKGRSDAIAHVLFDSVRGAGGNKEIGSNVTYAEGGNSSISYGFLSSFNSDGFTVRNGTSSPNQADYTNKNSSTYASWNWKAGGTAVSNTAGSITSSVSANTTAGFSIVSYTGNGTGNSTIGHGLGAIPKFIIVKNRSATGAWGTKNPAYNSPADPKVLYFDIGTADSSQNVWGTSASFTTLTFTVGDWSGSNTSSQNYIAYCFADVKGYSKMGSYVGNGSATDGTFVYLGFKPSFILVRSYTTASSWNMHDNKRQTFNDGSIPYFKANTSDAELSASNMDFLSNGFKFRTTDNDFNGSGQSYIYMAFAENPLVGSNGIPTTAR